MNNLVKPPKNYNFIVVTTLENEKLFNCLKSLLLSSSYLNFFILSPKNTQLVYIILEFDNTLHESSFLNRFYALNLNYKKEYINAYKLICFLRDDINFNFIVSEIYIYSTQRFSPIISAILSGSNKTSEFNFFSFVSKLIDLDDEDSVVVLPSIFTGSALFLNEVSSIMEDQSISDTRHKQLKLENLHSSHIKLQGQLRYSFSDPELKYVKAVQELLKSSEVFDFTSEGISKRPVSWETAKSIEIKKLRKKLYNKVNYISIQKFLFFKNIYGLVETFALGLIYLIFKTFRDAVSNFHENQDLSYNIYSSDTIKPISDYSEILLKYKNTTDLTPIYLFNRTKIKESLANHFFELIRNQIVFERVGHKRGLKLYKDKVELQNTLFEEKKKDIRVMFSQKFTKGLKHEMGLYEKNGFNRLIETNLLTIEGFLKLDTYEVGYFGDILLSILEKSGLLQSNLEKQFKDEKFVTTNYISIAEELNPSFVDVFPTVSGLPLLTSPKEWVLDKIPPQSNVLLDKEYGVLNDKELNFGGFEMNDFGHIFPSISLHTDGSTARLSDDEKDVINYLQTNEYEINKEFLDIISKKEKFFNLALLSYIDSPILADYKKTVESKFTCTDSVIDNTESIFCYNVNTATLKLKSKKHFMKDYTTISSKEDKEKKSGYQRAYNIYSKQILQVNNYLLIIGMAEIFKNRKFFYTFTFDFRLRIYPNRAGLLSNQSNNLCKSLIELSNSSLLDVSNISKEQQSEISNYEEDVKAVNKKALHNNPSKMFCSLKDDNGIRSKTVSFDVSASGLQIYSLLTGNLRGLELTNFLEVPGKKNTKSDAYSYIQNGVVDKLKASTLAVKNNSKAYNFLINSFIDNCTRADYKDLIMCFFYSEKEYSRAIKIVKIIEKDFKKVYAFLSIECGIMKPEKIIKEIFSVAIRIAKVYPEAFCDIFPDIDFVLNTLQDFVATSELVKKNKGILLKISNSINSANVFYKILKLDTVKFEYVTHVGNQTKKHTYNKSIYSDKLDLSKAKSSICPNFIHRIDSALLIETTLRLKESCVRINPFHDSFHSSPKNYEIIRLRYFDACVKLLLEDCDVLETFITSNVDKIPENIQARLNEFKKNRLDIRTKIKAQTLKMSTKILTP
jgi:hypothetical protein